MPRTGCRIVRLPSLSCLGSRVKCLLLTTNTTAPANQVLEYEYRRTPPYQVDNPFAGEPRPELDQAWHDLLEGTFVGVSASDFAKVNATSVPIDGTDTYLAQLGVFHELHCLKKIKQFVNWEYYHPNSTKEEYAVQAEHMGMPPATMVYMSRTNPAERPLHRKAADGDRLPW